MSSEFFREIKEILNNKINKKIKQKFILWNTHDVIITEVLINMNMISLNCLKNVYFNKSQEICLEFPEYGAELRFELHKEII